jgi:sugar phosphate isomerase/epimerase
MRKLLFLSILAACLLSACTDKVENKEIGLQLYSLRDDVKNLGIEKVLEEVGLMGYSKVELAGYSDGLIYGMEPLAFKELAEQHGLKVTSTHVVRKRTKDHEADMAFWSKAIEAHATMGVKFIIMPAYPFRGMDTITLEDVKRTCDYFNEVGKMAAEAGLKFGYHNHQHEFTNTVDGTPIYDLMLEHLDEAHVFLQMDVFWTTVGGFDPVDYFKDYPGRFLVLHIKDQHAIGASGMIDFAAILEAAYEQGMVDYYVEVEEYEGTPMEDVKQSFDFLDSAPYVK